MPAPAGFLVSGSEHPGQSADDAEIDRTFREIVAGLRSDGAGQNVNPPWPGETTRSSQTERPETTRSHDRGPAAAPNDPWTPRAPSHLGPGTPEGMATDHRSYEPAENEDDDHYIPPPPPPLPAGDLHFWGIVVGLVLGPALIVLSAVVPALGPIWALAGALLGIGGFVLLVLRQPRRRGLGDGDDGARV